LKNQLYENFLGLISAEKGYKKAGKIFFKDKSPDAPITTIVKFFELDIDFVDII
jgi:hypothetical protein